MVLVYLAANRIVVSMSLYPYLSLYRPMRLDGVQYSQGSWIPIYSLGDLRARLFGIRVPVLWALDKILTHVRLPKESELNQ